MLLIALGLLGTVSCTIQMCNALLVIQGHTQLYLVQLHALSSLFKVCPTQTTSTAGSRECVECHKGDKCFCDVGYTLDTGEGCIKCVQGKYKNAIGAQACTPCLL
jgi:hypothetical protein